MGSEMCIRDRHVPAQHARFQHGGSGKQCMRQNSMKRPCSLASSAAESGAGLRCVGDSCNAQNQWAWGGAASYGLRRKRQPLKDVWPSSLGCLSVRQVRWVSGRWCAVASAMTHAAHASWHLNAFTRAPMLSRRMRGVQHGPPARLLKM